MPSKVSPDAAADAGSGSPPQKKKKKRAKLTDDGPGGLSSAEKKLLKPYTFSGPLARLFAGKANPPQQITGLEAAVVRMMKVRTTTSPPSIAELRVLGSIARCPSHAVCRRSHATVTTHHSRHPSPQMSGSQVRRCHGAYKKIDFDGSGTITIKEFIYYIGAEPTKVSAWRGVVGLSRRQLFLFGGRALR